MKSCLWIALLVTLLVGTKTQDGFDLSDAFDDDEKPTPKVPVKPKDPIPEPKKPAVVPPKSGGSVDEFDLSDGLGPDLEPKKPAVVPPKDGGTGGGSFGDSDLHDLTNGGDYKPDPGTGGRKAGTGGDVDNADQPQDLERLWGQFLKMVDDNMPGGVHVWISNIKQAVAPLLEKAMEYLDMGQ